VGKTVTKIFVCGVLIVFWLIALKGGYSFWRDNDEVLSMTVSVIGTVVFLLPALLIAFISKQSKDVPTTNNSQPSDTSTGNLIKCKDCGHDVSRQASKCPRCGAPIKSSNPQSSSGCLGVVVLILMTGFGYYYYFGGGLERESGRTLKNIQNQVAVDVEKQYEIAKRSGTAIDAYTQASLAAECYLQAKDEENYKKWKAIAKQEAVRAGVPFE
jgi:hypothetical protein